MLKTNHHAHTYFSDGHGSAEEFLLGALDRGFDRYGFSDHAPIMPSNIGSMPVEELAAYGREVERLRAAYGDRIMIHKSLEVDYLPGVQDVNSEHIVAAELDYTVGAVHFVGELDGLPWSFQRPNPNFERGIAEIFGGDARAMVTEYFRLVREMVETAPPDIVAHLDRVKKRNLQGTYWDEHADWFGAEVDATLETIAASDCIFEVNTRGLYKGEINETYPSRWIVRRAHDMGIPLQVNSDAHEIENVDGGFDFAYAALREMGVRNVRVFGREGFEDVLLDAA